MNENIKVAVFWIRTVKLDPSYCLTMDNDIPPVYGTVETNIHVCFSENLGENQELVYKTISHIPTQISKEIIKVSPDEPWVDTTPVKRFFEKDLTREVVEILSKAIPNLKFCAAAYPDEANQLLKKYESEMKKRRRKEWWESLSQKGRNFLGRIKIIKK